MRVAVWCDNLTPLPIFLPARGAAADVFDCIEPPVRFFKAPLRLLLVTGEAGYGEEEMTSDLVERLQLALPVDAKLLRASFGRLPTFHKLAFLVVLINS